MERTRHFRGISTRAARHYLVGLGGEAVDDRTVVGDGWEAGLEADVVRVGPSLRLTEVTVRFRGDDDVVPAIVDTFAKKAMRAGG